MVFIMDCYKKQMGNIKKRFLLSILFVGLILTNVAFADGIRLRQIQFEPIDQNWVINASYQIELPTDLSDAVKKGITFHFVTEFNVTRGRWYWFEEKPISALKSIKLSYQPLTQLYRINVGALTVSANTLEEALIQVGAIAGWQVAELSALENGKQYDAAIRMRLDLSQLPKPFQINALNAREWNLVSEWQHFTVTPKYKVVAK
jgi:Domain of unknown function (DUF4390)